jgi:MFS family permease
MEEQMNKRPRRKRTPEVLAAEERAKDQIKRFLGIQVKRKVTLTQLLSIFLVMLVASIAGTGTQLQTIFLLQDTLEYNLDAGETASELGQLTMKIEVYTMIGTLVSAIIFGYMYEIVGRRKVLFVSIIVLSGAIVSMPFT